MLIIPMRIRQVFESEQWHDERPFEAHTGGFTRVPLPVNELSKKKRTMRHTMRKPREPPFKRFATRLTDINN